MPARVLWSAVLIGWVGAAPALGQTPELLFCRQPVFRIPFQIELSEQPRLKEVQLYVSEDQGRTWRYSASAAADQRSFSFKADRDGLYWFAVRTKDTEGRFFPASLDGAKPQLRVLVDTQLPSATLRPLPPKGEQVGVEWEVRDENLDPLSLQLEYRTQNAGNWAPVLIEPQAVGQRYWTPSVRGPLEVRLRARDKAENQATAQIPLSNQGSGAGTGDGARPRHNIVPPGATVKVVNSTDISLNYSLEDVGPSGVSLVELWYTIDGRSWQRYGEDPDKTSPFNMKVNGEGTYGLTLVVRSGVGLGDKPPQPGDPPQLWVEVDLTKPVVQVLSVDAGRGGEAGTLTVTWTASDRHLAGQPISLFYAEQSGGDWKPIATGLDNTGRYVWRIPPSTPYRFLVRVEAADRGGNLGVAETAKPVIVDLAQPKGRLLGIEGGPKS